MAPMTLLTGSASVCTLHPSVWCQVVNILLLHAQSALPHGSQPKHGTWLFQTTQDMPAIARLTDPLAWDP